MEYLKLGAEYLKIVMWPLLTLVLSCMFRQPISEALGRLNSLELLGLQAGFTERSQAVREETELLAASPPREQGTDDSTGSSSGCVLPPDLGVAPVPVPTGDFARAERMARSAPAQAVEFAWDSMNGTLQEASRANGVSYDPRQHGPSLWAYNSNRLRDAGIDSEAWSVFSDLRSLYRAATTTPSAVTADAAADFVNACLNFTMRALDTLAPR